MPVQPTIADKSTGIDGTTQIAPIGPFYTRREVALSLRLTVRSVDTLLANGKLPHLKVGGAVRFTAQQLQDALKTFTVVRRPPPSTPGRDEIKKETRKK
jgi:excisionase family DNA binding protein